MSVNLSFSAQNASAFPVPTLLSARLLIRLMLALALFSAASQAAFAQGFGICESDDFSRFVLAPWTEDNTHVSINVTIDGSQVLVQEPAIETDNLVLGAIVKKVSAAGNFRVRADFVLGEPPGTGEQWRYGITLLDGDGDELTFHAASNPNV